MQVFLIRHTSVDVPKGTCYGQTDVPLNASFPDEAAQVKAKLSIHEPFDQAYCSPLSRCVKLAEYCDHSDAIRDKRLMEVNLGEWEMQLYDEITDPRLQEWYDDFLHVPTTGGESFQDVIRRVGHFLEELKKKSFQKVAIFAHGGVLMATQVYLNLIDTNNLFDHDIPYGGIIEVTL